MPRLLGYGHGAPPSLTPTFGVAPVLSVLRFWEGAATVRVALPHGASQLESLKASLNLLSFMRIGTPVVPPALNARKRVAKRCCKRLLQPVQRIRLRCFESSLLFHVSPLLCCTWLCLSCLALLSGKASPRCRRRFPTRQDAMGPRLCSTLRQTTSCSWR